MKKAPGPKKSGQGAAVVGKRKFTGTDNPRHLRALAVLGVSSENGKNRTLSRIQLV